ncbi:murein L,D-transpeptidase [compost metagenome]
MRKLILYIAAVIFSFLFVAVSCKKNETTSKKTSDSKSEVASPSEIPFDSTLVKPFFDKYPKLKNFESDVVALYLKQQYHYIWYDEKGITELGSLLYNKILNLEEEGVQVPIPYKEKLDNIFQDTNEKQRPNTEDELLLSSLYFFYADKVFKGIDPQKSEEQGWYLPRKKQSYVNYLDSIISKPSLINKDEKEVLGQYYRLRGVLQKYRAIEKKGGWNAIVLDSAVKSLKPGDSSETIRQIRQRLLVTGELSADSKSNLYDDELREAILKYKKNNAFSTSSTITPDHIASLNIPVTARIKTIVVNMERCRWLSTDISKSKELIVVNIPAFQLTYFKNGEPVLFSKVVVGKALNKTVIFHADMKYIVFSPYWNVPKSIIKKEIEPAVAKNPNYLAKHEMEWHKGVLRQRPGPKNSLGLIKFLFPNSNSIYLHDTPSKSLFEQEKRAFSHGCIRVEKPKELANLILEDDKNWTPEKIEAAMNKGEESWYTLQNKIPVYIGYFTAWVNDKGEIHFYDDIYDRDESLAAILLEE